MQPGIQTYKAIKQGNNSFKGMRAFISSKCCQLIWSIMRYVITEVFFIMFSHLCKLTMSTIQRDMALKLRCALTESPICHLENDMEQVMSLL